MNLSKCCEIVRVENAAVAGTTDLISDAVDMAGWDGVMFIYAAGALTAGQVTKLTAAQCDTSGGSYVALTSAVTGAMADGDSNKLLVLDIFRPTKRYVQATFDRGTQNAVIDGGIAIKYCGSKSPVTQGSTVAVSALVASPAEA